MKNLILPLIPLLLTLTALTASSALKEVKPITLDEHNTVYLNGPIKAQTVNPVKIDLLSKIQKRKNLNYPIYLVIDSPGGNVALAMSFVEFFSQYKNIKTVCIYCASAAHMIAQLLPGSRLTPQNGLYMAHRAKTVLQGAFTIEELTARLKFFNNYITEIETRLSKRLKISLAEYRRRIASDWYSPARTAIKENVADSLVKIKCTPALINKKIKKTISNILFSKTFYISACPTYKAVFPAPKK